MQLGNCLPLSKRSQTKRIYMKKCLLAIVLSLLFFVVVLGQQPRRVTVKVVSKENTPLESVSLKLKGTNVGGQTNKNGSFILTIPGKGEATLIVTHIGFKSQTIIITLAQTEVNIILEEDKSVNLDEVVVINIGYSSVAKSKLAGSISSVSEKDLKDFPVSSAAEALAGKLAGVSVQTSEGAPGADIQIKVRGGTSLTQDNSPLYIVDGVEMENALSVLSPDEIKSIDVLKDVASTSIYGSRGANGVVLITTKAGKRGRTIINFSTNTGVRKVTNEIKVLNPYDFVMYEYELYHLHYNGYYLPDTANTFANKYGAFNDLDIYKSIPMVDWQNRVFGRSAPSNSQVLSMSGGSDGTTYYATLNNYNENGVMVNTGLKRTIGSFRFENKVSDRLKVGINGRYSQQEIDGTGTSDVGTSANNTLKNDVRFQPYNGLINVEDYDPNAVYDVTINLSNPLAAALNTTKYRKSNSLFTSGTLNYQILPNNKLTFNSVVGLNIADTSINTFQGVTSYQVANTSSTNAGMPFIILQTATGKEITNTNTFSYRPIFSAAHTLNILLGEETNQVDATGFSQTIKYFPTNATADQAFANVQLANPPSGYIQAAPASAVTGSRMISFFGRAMYSLNGKYNFNASIRRDGSSKFSAANRWATFPSAQFSWKMSDEKFMSNLNLKWLSYLKVRASYGAAGNNRIGSNNLYSTTFATSATNAGYAVGDASINPGLYSANLANPNLKWETIISRNLGIDFELFNGKLSVSIDGYINHTKDLLLNSYIPQQTGYVQQFQNVGKTQNKGVELQLSGTVVRSKGFNYTASFNMSFNKNAILELQGGVPSYTVSSGWGTAGDDFLVQVGQPVGQFYGYVSDGFYTLKDFDQSRSVISDPTHAKWVLNPGVADASAILGQAVVPGVMKLKKLGDIKSDSVIRTTDRTSLGNNQPLFFGGFNNQFTYKNFDLSIFVNFSYGNKEYNANSIEFSSAYKAVGNNMLAKFANRWKTFDANGQYMTDWNEIAAANVNAKTYAPTRGNYILRSDVIEDGSFLRVTNISLGYSMPKRLLDYSVFSSFRIYATVNNLYTFTKYSGFDPEASTRRISPLTPGVDYSAYPRSRYMLIGLNVGF